MDDSVRSNKSFNHELFKTTANFHHAIMLSYIIIIHHVDTANVDDGYQPKIYEGGCLLN